MMMWTIGQVQIGPHLVNSICVGVAWRTRQSLIFGKVRVTHKYNLHEVPTSEIKLVDISEVRLAELVDLPIVVDTNQGQQTWITYLYEKKSPFFWAVLQQAQIYDNQDEY